MTYDLDDALYSRPYVRGLRSIEIRPGEDIENRIQLAPRSHEDGPAMRAALEAMAEAGRKSPNWFNRRPLP